MAFVAFPTLINEAPAGALIGVLFFGSLVLAGITSLISVIEVVISAVRDKFEMTRVSASLVVGVPAAVISIVLLGTTTGVYVLDIVDHFINRFGILLVAAIPAAIAYNYFVSRVDRFSGELEGFACEFVGADDSVSAVSDVSLSVLQGEIGAFGYLP